MSSETSTAADPTPRRPPEAVIADYLGEFVGVDQPPESPKPDAVALIRWLRDEGWEIRPAL